MDENDFFRQITLRICEGLDMETTMRRCLQYLGKVMPADWICLNVFEWDLGVTRILLLVTEHEGRWSDTITVLPPDIWQRMERQDIPGTLFVPRPGLDPVEVHIANHPEQDLVMEQFWHIPESHDASITMHLKAPGGYVGCLVLGAKGRDRYTAEHARLLALLYEPFVVALTNVLKHQEVTRLRDLLADDNRYLHRVLFHMSGDEIVGADFGLSDAMGMVRKVAHLDSPVLLRGETGVGKDVVAHAIHLSSSRKDGPFIKVNCGAIPETLIDSELFGHEKGAFTGAIAQSRGCFERANMGTIFLDEIGELPLAAQVRLLRVIQYREIQRVGGATPIFVNIRIIAATHRNLEEMVATERFREDLWFRLNVFPITIPPLRERRRDIPALVRHFIQRKTKDLRLPPPQGMAPGAIDRLISYDWPGNVRELENVVERALILSGGGLLEFEWLSARGSTSETTDFPSPARRSWALDDVVSRHIKEALKETKGRIHGPGGAAELLGVRPNTLRSRMDKLGIPYRKSPRGESEGSL